jgi:tRNA threonylcarbamoyladenosine biosynthesis protein TsaE
MDIVFESASEDCSLSLGRKIGELLLAGDILALWGELGAGKTLLTRGIARGLGIPPQTRVTSPTFTIINEYSGRLYLYHLDLYRITEPDELETLPWQESLFGNGAAVVEWPERLDRMLPAERWDLKLSITGEENRRIVITPRGKRNRERAPRWRRELERLKLEPPCRGL